MEIAYTKGNWQRHRYKPLFIVNSQDLVEQTIICQVFGNGEEAEANAHLLAASKDMFEALQVLLKEARQDNFRLTHSLNDTPAEAMAQAALNKAQGKTN